MAPANDGWESLPASARELEARAMRPTGAPTYAAAYVVLRDAWRAGDRRREVGLHLMFLAWYLLVEPPHITGLDENVVPSRELAPMFDEVHRHFEPTILSDIEMLYVVGLLAHMVPWVLGEMKHWQWTSELYRRAYRRLAPGGIDPAIFDGRGVYGEYFGGQARVVGGY